mgnify:CR=1 FL=1
MAIPLRTGRDRVRRRHAIHDHVRPRRPFDHVLVAMGPSRNRAARVAESVSPGRLHTERILSVSPSVTLPVPSTVSEIGTGRCRRRPRVNVFSATWPTASWARIRSGCRSGSARERHRGGPGHDRAGCRHRVHRHVRSAVVDAARDSATTRSKSCGGAAHRDREHVRLQDRRCVRARDGGRIAIEREHDWCAVSTLPARSAATARTEYSPVGAAAPAKVFPSQVSSLDPAPCSVPSESVTADVAS